MIDSNFGPVPRTTLRVSLVQTDGAFVDGPVTGLLNGGFCLEPSCSPTRSYLLLPSNLQLVEQSFRFFLTMN
jgi:hypothetical protein